MPDIDSMIDDANGLFKKGKRKKALAAYQEAARQAPESERAHCGVAFALMMAGRFDEASESAQKIARMRPGAAYAYGVMGAALERAGRRGDALACYEKVLEMDPDYEVAGFKVALMMILEGRKEEGNRRFDAVAGDPEDPDFARIKGVAEMARDMIGKDDKAAEVASILSPGVTEMGSILFGENPSSAVLVADRDSADYEEKEAAARISARMRANEFMARADSLAVSGRFSDAAKAVDKVLNADPDYPGAHSIKAGMLSKAGRFAEAVECMDEVIKRSTEPEASMGSKGMMLEKLGRYDEAAECYDRIIEMKPGEITAYYLKCGLLARAGDADGLAECYRAALAAEPSDKEGRAAGKAMRAEYRRLCRHTKAAGSAAEGLARFARDGGVELQPVWGRKGEGPPVRKRARASRMRAGRRR